MKTVRRAYAIDRLFNTKQRVLVDEHGLVFVPGNAWLSCMPDHIRLVFLPGEVPYHDWWDGWWQQNWQMPDWSWCYGFKDLSQNLN